MTQACTLSLSFLPLSMLMSFIFFSRSSRNPEMQYLQQEMRKRRDKRLELASRQRSYEVANATKRRNENGVWSWVVFQGKYGASQTIASWLNAIKTTWPLSYRPENINKPSTKSLLSKCPFPYNRC